MHRNALLGDKNSGFVFHKPHMFRLCPKERKTFPDLLRRENLVGDVVDFRASRGTRDCRIVRKAKIDGPSDLKKGLSRLTL
jgi:hypothetical protein